MVFLFIQLCTFCFIFIFFFLLLSLYSTFLSLLSPLFIIISAFSLHIPSCSPFHHFINFSLIPHFSLVLLFASIFPSFSIRSLIFPLPSLSSLYPTLLFVFLSFFRSVLSTYSFLFSPSLFFPIPSPVSSRLFLFCFLSCLLFLHLSLLFLSILLWSICSFNPSFYFVYLFYPLFYQPFLFKFIFSFFSLFHLLPNL